MELQKLQSTPKIGLFTGSFDPVTNGHLDIISRAAELFDKLYVGIFDNPDKSYLFSIEERLALLQENLINYGQIELLRHDSKNLTVRIAKAHGVTSLVRSARSGADFDYEANMAYFNREMTGIETLVLFADPKLAMISSSRVKELAGYGQSVKDYVPKNVREKLEAKFARD